MTMEMNVRVSQNPDVVSEVITKDTCNTIVTLTSSYFNLIINRRHYQYSFQI